MLLGKCAEDASQRWKEEVDADGWYQGCSNYLKELGIDNRAEIARVLDIATNPKSLYHMHRDKKREGNSMVSLMQSLMQCLLKSLHVASPGVCRHIAQEILQAPKRLLMPSSLLEQARKLTAEGDLKPWVEFFQEQGLSKEEIVKVSIHIAHHFC